MKILMVCLGNICRSPLAEGILQHKAREAGLNWEVDSAGTNSYHTGEAPHELSQKVAAINGIDICDQRARRFTKEDFEKFDIIYAMADDVYNRILNVGGLWADKEKVKMFLDELEPGSNASVLDPWYGDESGYLPVYELINKTCDAIIEKYK